MSMSTKNYIYKKPKIPKKAETEILILLKKKGELPPKKDLLLELEKKYLSFFVLGKKTNCFCYNYESIDILLDDCSDLMSKDNIFAICFHDEEYNANSDFYFQLDSNNLFVSKLKTDCLNELAVLNFQENEILFNMFLKNNCLIEITPTDFYYYGDFYKYKGILLSKEIKEKKVKNIIKKTKGTKCALQSSNPKT